MQRRVLPCLVALILLGGVRTSLADNLYFTSDFNTTSITITVDGSSRTLGGGGNIGATLNGTSLGYMYCLQYSVDVTVPGLYDTTKVTTNGQVYSGTQYVALTSNTSNTALFPAGGSNTSAQEIAWLIYNYGPTAGAAEGQGNYLPVQAGLQALIWQILTPGLTIDQSENDPGVWAAYSADYGNLTAAIAKGPLTNYTSDMYWMTPLTDASSTTTYQEQVAFNPSETTLSSVPEPGTMGMGAVGILFMSYCLRRRRLL